MVEDTASVIAFSQGLKMIIKFTAEWCGKCRMFKDVEVDKIIDVDNGADDYVAKYDVRELPTFVKTDEEGNMISKLEGPYSIREFNEWK